MRSVAFAAAMAAACAAKYTLLVDVKNMTTPYAPATVTWSGITEASKGDWLAACCSAPTGGYFWWIYATGAPSGSASLPLWANGLDSGCDSVLVSYYTGSNAVIAQSAAIPVSPMIQQIHISVTPKDSDAVLVEFVSSAGGKSPACSYGTSPSSMTSTATGASHSFAQVGEMAAVLLTGLQPATQYFYACTDGVVTSLTYNFTHKQNARPPVIAVFADFGVDDGFGLYQITADAQAGVFDFVLHAGDWAYDMESSNSANGNFFMNRGMAYSAHFPLMPAPGNHEANGGNFTQYQERFSGVASYSNSGSALFYSFEWEGVHFLAFNSETYIDGGIQDMLAFMRSDLAGVDRTATPWVVAFSHKLWWMDSTDFSSISGILANGGVDVLFAGHWHFYQRYLPYDPVTGKADINSMSADNHTSTDPAYLTMIVSGAPGDVERNDGCPGDNTVAPITPACSSGYGYGTFTPMNATHLYWQFTADTTPIGADPVDVALGHVDTVSYTDYLWIVRSSPPA